MTRRSGLSRGSSVIKDMEQGGSRRLDVFEFAFESDGRIGRIRRRAAMPSDIEEAMRYQRLAAAASS